MPHQHNPVEAGAGRAGAPGAFALATFVGGHGFPDEMKRVAYRFLERALRG